MPRASEPLQRAARDRLHGLAVPHGPPARQGPGELQGLGEPPVLGEPGEVTSRRVVLEVPAVAPGWVPEAPSADVGLAGTPLEPTASAADVDSDSQAAPGSDASGAAQWGTPPDAQDVRDVVARIRAGALDSAAAAYTSVHGHPLEHPSADAPVGRPRWLLSVRLALVAALAVVVLGAGVVARATLSAPSVPVATAPAPGGPLVEGAAGSEGAARSVDAAGPGETSAGPGAAVPAPSPADVVVHVVGQVNTPGVVHLPTGSRVADAVAAAGGAAPRAVLAAVNLARVLQDGEQIVVPAPGEVALGTTGAGGAAATGAGGAGAASGGDASALLDLNTADAADLESLPGIGPVLAQRIVDWRIEHTRFTAVDELGEVAGIGDTLLGRLRELVRV